MRGPSKVLVDGGNVEGDRGTVIDGISDASLALAHRNGESEAPKAVRIGGSVVGIDPLAGHVLVYRRSFLGGIGGCVGRQPSDLKHGAWFIDATGIGGDDTAESKPDETVEVDGVVTKHGPTHELQMGPE